MSARPIVTYPSPVLSDRAREVTEVTAEIQQLFDDMVESMFAENGIGVAAPQVGEGVRAIVIDADYVHDRLEDIVRNAELGRFGFHSLKNERK